jgi:hypothetical protein
MTRRKVRATSRDVSRRPHANKSAGPLPLAPPRHEAVRKDNEATRPLVNLLGSSLCSSDRTNAIAAVRRAFDERQVVGDEHNRPLEPGQHDDVEFA